MKTLRSLTALAVTMACLGAMPALGAESQTLTKATGKANGRYLRIKVAADQNTLAQLSALGISADHGEVEGGAYTTEVSNAEYEQLRYLVPNEVVIRDLEKYYADRNALDVVTPHEKVNRTQAQPQATFGCNYPTPAGFTLGSMGGYKTLNEMLAELDQMAAQYPNLITVRQPLSTTLTTYEGRQVFYVKISDNPNVDEAEPRVLYTALHHAREPMSMMSLLFYMRHLLENYATDPAIQTLVNSTEMYFVPCLNPDGYTYNQITNPNGGGMWRKNRRANGGTSFGVDLNRNYGFQWGLNTGSSSTTTSDTYRGPSPFSEPETQMIRDLCISKSFITTFNEHSYSSILIHPYEYVNAVPEPSVVTAIAADLRSCNLWPYGNTPQLLGYLASGTATDWMYGEQTAKPKIYAYTPEIGSSAQGFWPASSAIEPLCNAMMYANLKLADYAIILTQCNGFAVNAGADQAICAGTNTTVVAGITGGAPTYSFLWNTGDTTSSITVNPATTTTYTVTVTDANGCTATDSMIVTVNTCNNSFCNGSPTVVNTNNFESSLGIWVSGGSNAARVIGNANSGTVSVRLRSNTTGSRITTGNQNLSTFARAEVSLSFITGGFASATDSFSLQMSVNGGTSYTTVKTWTYLTDFANGVRQNPALVLNGPFTTTTRFRFQCNSASTSRAVYLDDIAIKACTN